MDCAMPPALKPENESVRLADLRSFDILDTVAEEAYDAITYLAAEICEVPIALISIVDDERQWFKSRVGIDATESRRDLAFCAYAIHRPSSLLVVPDASVDPRFCSNPLVTDDPSIRFYAGAPLVSPAGNALGTLCVIDREPRELSEDQEKALAALSGQVMALLELRRTVRDLEQKQREVEAATAQRDSFMATVSHEIRGPLPAVVGYVELLRAGLSDAERGEVLASVAREAADVEYLIEDLLVSARAEAKSLRVASVQMRLDAQIAQVLEGLDRADTARMVVSVTDCRFIGDPARVRQIIRNLVTNALRYGGPSIRLEARRSGDSCHVIVSDDGAGIDPADRDLVFEPFKQAESSRHVAASVGLGLPISRLLAEKMGGSLTYRFEESCSVFELALPASRD
jgi:signal transduction histidine kinase